MIDLIIKDETGKSADMLGSSVARIVGVRPERDQDAAWWAEWWRKHQARIMAPR